MPPIRNCLVVLLLATISVAASAAEPAPSSQVQPLVAKDLTALPGKEGVLLEVTFPPGGSDPMHRHDADVFVYVLEGSIVMQVKGGREVTLEAGETFHESPQDIHVVGRNASSTEPARFLAFFVKNKGAPPVLPVK